VQEKGEVIQRAAWGGGVLRGLRIGGWPLMDKRLGEAKAVGGTLVLQLGRDVY